MAMDNPLGPLDVPIENWLIFWKKAAVLAGVKWLEIVALMSLSASVFFTVAKN